MQPRTMKQVHASAHCTFMNTELQIYNFFLLSTITFWALVSNELSRLLNVIIRMEW